mgnify:CR=1 FL=1
MSRNLYPEDIYLSPCFAIKRFLGLRDEYGDLEAVTNGEYKPEREMWITGVFLLGIGLLTGKEYWLRPNREDSAPDIFAISPVGSKKGVVAETQNIEIFEYESHSKGTLIEAIRGKLSGKAYTDNYLLLCYVHDRAGEEFNTKEVCEAVKSISPNISQIWVLTNTLGTVNTEHVMVQVFPNYILRRYNYIELCKSSKQIEMIKARRDLTKITTEVEFEPLGKYILKLP